MKPSFIALSATIIAVIGFVGISRYDEVAKAVRSVSFTTGTDTASPLDEKNARTGNADPAGQTIDTVTTAATEPVVDESALRYFASHGDTARLETEISRLRALYPDWTPPKDPLAIPQNSDTQLESMWQLYSQARYAELRKAIAERQIAESGWAPPADLTDRLTVAEGRVRLMNASDVKQYETVVRIGAETPSLLTCSEVDVLWRLAEAFFKTGKAQRATDAYAYILNNCESSAERLATVQKAASLLPPETVQDLLTKEKTAQDGTKEFDAIRDDLARGYLARAEADEKITVPASYLDRVERLAEAGGLASDALLLGWYHLPRGDGATAEKWFRRARDKEDSAEASQGLALALLERDAPLEAEEIMYRWRDASPDAKSVYLAATAGLLARDPPVSLTPQVLKRIAAEVIEARDAATAQQFGWYARALNQPQTALQWFKTALSWKPDDEPSAYGLAVTYLQLEDAKALSQIQRLWAGRSERIAKVGEAEEKSSAETERSSVRTEAVIDRKEAPAHVQVVSAEAERPQRRVIAARPRAIPQARAVRGCSTTINPQTLEPQTALARGWCLMDLNRPLEAAAAFEIALLGASAKTREDAAYGQSLAYLRAGLASKAAVAAIKAPQNRQRATELQKAILAENALAAFDAGRARETLLVLDQLKQMGAERADLLSLRGYAYLKMKRYSDARRIFEALAATGNRDGQRGLAIIHRIFREKN